MNKYEQPNVEVLSFRPDESLMDQGIGGTSGGQPGNDQGGGGFNTFALHDSRDNR